MSSPLPRDVLPLAQRLAGPASPRYTAICLCFAFATLLAALPGILFGPARALSLVQLFGAAAVAITRGLAGWIVCALCSAGLILFYEDQLTQTLLLLLFALCAVVCWAGSRDGRDHRLEHDLPVAIGALTIGAYAVAALHKLNRDFFDPAVSCAGGGVLHLGLEWGVSTEAIAAWPGWPAVFIAAEIALALLWATRPGHALLLGLLVHIPLTVVFAPSFVFIMMIGWAALLTPAAIRALTRTARARWPRVLTLGLLLAAASLSQHTGERCFSVNADWCLKEALLWVVAALVVMTLLDPAHRQAFRRASLREAEVTRRGRWLTLAVTLGWLAHGLLPYTGLTFHRSGAMLSNLRVDAGCWNSLLIPESARLVEPYIRVDHIAFTAAPGERIKASSVARLERSAPRTLWTRESLEKARAGWCRTEGRRVVIRGTHAGGDFEADVCVEWPFGALLFPGMRRYQKNLRRACPQRCIH